MDEEKWLQLEREKQQMIEYSQRDIVVKIEFTCKNENRIHCMTVFDYEMFMLYKHTNGDTSEEICDMIKKRIEEENKKKKIYFGLGTVSNAPFARFIIGSIIRLPNETKNAGGLDFLVQKN